MLRAVSAHPGEYRPYGGDTLWCETGDHAVDRTKVSGDRCPEHEPAIEAFEELVNDPDVLFVGTVGSFLDMLEG